MPEQHACTFDFKKEAAHLLITKNPKVVAEKLDKV